MDSTHVIISTHTTRHLARTLLGVACQTDAPASVTVSSDTDDPAIATLVQDSTQRLQTRVILVQRPHQGESRSSQVRNNAVRAALATGALPPLAPAPESQRDHRQSLTQADPHEHTLPPSPDARLWFLDGDCCPAPEAQAMHLSLGRHSGLVVGFRIDMTSEQTDAMSEDLLRAGLWPIRPTAEQLAILRWRHRRYARAAFLRRLGLAKPHKPKLLSANFSVMLSDYARINGFDESYVGYGQEDDDLGRRLYRAGVRPVIGVATAVALHQWHQTRAPGDWDKSPNAARFAREFQVRCRAGMCSPAPQPQPIVRVFDRGVCVEELALPDAGGIQSLRIAPSPEPQHALDAATDAATHAVQD